VHRPPRSLDILDSQGDRKRAKSTGAPQRSLATPLRSLGILGAAAALVGVVVVALLLWNRLGTGQQTAGDAAPPIRSIAVLPLENLSGDAGEDDFVTGMHEALITDLAGIGLQKVIAKSSRTPSRARRERHRKWDGNWAWTGS
jgi:hypothetical protein